MSRRKFLKSSIYSASAITILPSSVLSIYNNPAPNDKLNIAAIGIGGMGQYYLKNVESENIIALCDVDDEFAAKVFNTYPKAKRYRDFRVLLEKEKEIDAVIVGTPDHTHTVIAMMALALGKHVYCAKPLARTINETRKLTLAARDADVATQVSMQANASEDHRLLCEWIWDGAIGSVKEVDIWSNRPIWPQGIERPVEIPSVPTNLDWNLWIGPAPNRPYHYANHPFNWRGWWDFGTGALGDMGCHGFDPIYRALKLGHPTSVCASSTKLFPETAPLASIIYYDFPARRNMPSVKVTWYDGGLKPDRPDVLEAGRKFGDDNFGGILFKGDDGMIMTGGLGQSPRIIPEKQMKAYPKPEKSLQRSVGHYNEWLKACKGGNPAGCDFKYAGPLTESVLLGNIAIRTGKKLFWDAENMNITNDKEANKYISEPYHNGWN